MKRNMLILLVLVTLTAATSGCTRCRNLFRRGSPCCGTSTRAPAMIGAPMAIGQPFAQPAPRIIAPQMIAPQMVAPQMVAPQVVVPHTHAVPCCPQVCEPCPTRCVPCVPCETGCVGGHGEWFGGYVGNGVVDGTCANCGPVTTYEGEYSGTVADPGPTDDN